MTTLNDSYETSATPTPSGIRRDPGRPRASRAGLVTGALALAVAACGSPPAPHAPAAPTSAPAEPERSAWPEPPQSESIVHAQLLTSAQAVKPRGKFLLAVSFEIASGWRISWQNPGDVGKRTHVHFEVPEGFSVGPIQFPAPQRYELPGDLVNYGYENETAIFAEVTAPDRLPDGHTYRFDVKADWLACNDDCATEELSAWFELASSGFGPEPELPRSLAAAYAALPRAFAELPESDLAWKGGTKQPALTLKAAEVKWLDFFPGDVEQPKLLAVKPAGDELKLRFASAASQKPMRGLAVAEVQGKTAFYDVNVPWPTE